jgi:hypothetical protein
MRKVGAVLAIAALAAVIFSSLPAAAFGIHLGPFYFHVPFIGHHYRHRLHMRANPNEARLRSSDSSSGGRYSAANTTVASESCTGLAPGVTNLPIDQIRQTIHPSADQEAGLDDLSAASSQASGIIKSSCPTSVPFTPVSRLDAAAQRVDATIKAIQVVRSPLERFYETLSDDQRRQFNAMNDSTKRARWDGNMAAVCSQKGGSFIDLPVQDIEQLIQPTAQQQSAFDNLKKATQKASDKLQSSCPSAVPLSPVARLDTLEAWLEVMADAIKSVRPALGNFYASLDDEQKARFNMIVPPPRAASTQPQGQSGR